MMPTRFPTVSISTVSPPVGNDAPRPQAQLTNMQYGSSVGVMQPLQYNNVSLGPLIYPQFGGYQVSNWNGPCPTTGLLVAIGPPHSSMGTLSTSSPSNDSVAPTHIILSNSNGHPGNDAPRPQAQLTNMQYGPSVGVLQPLQYNNVSLGPLIYPQFGGYQMGNWNGPCPTTGLLVAIGPPHSSMGTLSTSSPSNDSVAPTHIILSNSNGHPGNYAPNPQDQHTSMEYGSSIAEMQPLESNNVSPGPAGQYTARHLPNNVPNSLFGSDQDPKAPNPSQEPPPAADSDSQHMMPTVTKESATATDLGHENGGQESTTPSTSKTVPSTREIAFSADSVETTTLTLCKSKPLTRSDVEPVDAQMLMRSLRSGLLAESTWALDTLGMRLSDDSTCGYFKLAHMPGLLDVLLEHFNRSLTNLFVVDMASTDPKWNQRPMKDSGNVELGCVKETFDPNDRVVVLESCNNYTLARRKKRAPVKFMNRECDTFVVDSRKISDVHGDVSEDSVEIESGTCQLISADVSSTSNIVPCFQEEPGTVPLVRLLRGKKEGSEENPNRDLELEKPCESSDKFNVDNVSVKESASVGDDKKNKKRARLNDVLRRIINEPLEMNNDLAREIRERVEKSKTVSHGKKEGETDSDITIQNLARHEKNEIGEDNISLNKECVKVDDIKKRNIVIREIETETPSCSKENGSESTCDLRIKGPAGTFKRRRKTDYEVECYTKDEECLVTETQDSIARRCVCLSNILRNLTFVPGNELEFTKSVTFLNLLGKLLLLQREHPVRTQKQRNHDGEKDAGFANSCSSLQGKSDWWWNILDHIIKNLLVIAANISGHSDFKQHSREILRPVLDGLLDYAVTPATHVQDPLPTVGTNSRVSPQHLALEALCNLSVTKRNFNLLIAIPPHSRQKVLSDVLTKLLHQNKEQVLQKKAVNLLRLLCTAKKSMAVFGRPGIES